MESSRGSHGIALQTASAGLRGFQPSGDASRFTPGWAKDPGLVPERQFWQPTSRVV